MQCTDLTLPEDLRSRVLIIHFDSSSHRSSSIGSSQSFAVVQCRCRRVCWLAFSSDLEKHHLLGLFKQVFVIFVHYIYANICIFQIHQVDFLRFLSHEYFSFLFLFQATQRHYSMCTCVCNFALQQDVS
jgi:hypothetical protein